MGLILAGGSFEVDEKTNKIKLNKNIADLTDEELDSLENVELGLRNTADATR